MLDGMPMRGRVGAGIIGFVACLGIGIAIKNASAGPADMVAGAVSGKMRVQVAGAVKKPGLVSIAADARIQDAIDAAGGATRDADLNRLNLADPMTDGAKLRVPTVDDGDEGPFLILPTAQAATVAPLTSNSKTSSSSKSRSSKAAAPPAVGSISLNNASAEELDRLPGVGPSTALKIIEFRTQVGGFKTIEQLMDVKGIGPKKFEKMRPFLKL